MIKAMKEWRQGNEKDVRAGCFRNLDAQQSFSTFTEFCTLGDESQTIKVHVRTTDDYNELLLGTNQFVGDDVVLQSSKSEGPRWLGDRSGFCNEVTIGTPGDATYV